VILPALLVSFLMGTAQVPDSSSVQAAPDAAEEQLVPDSLDGERYGRLSRPGLTLRFAPRDTLVAEQVMAYLAGLPPLPGMPDTVPSGVVTVLAHSPEALDALTGGLVPEWRAGVAIPSRGLIIVPTGEGPRILDLEGRRTLRHEWAHVALHQRLGGMRAPRWFDEGYAQWASGGFDATEAWRLRVLIAMGRAPSLDSLALRWPRGRTAAESAYLLSASALTYLLAESGERGLDLFFDRWARGGSFEGALRATFGVTSGQFEEDWKKHVKDRYGWLFVLSHSAVFWMVLALVLLLMMRVRLTRDREQMARLRAGEPPDRPAFWTETDKPEGPESPPHGVD
jgi:hypothetical protein